MLDGERGKKSKKGEQGGGPDWVHRFHQFNQRHQRFFHTQIPAVGESIPAVGEKFQPVANLGLSLLNTSKRLIMEKVYDLLLNYSLSHQSGRR